MRTMRRLATVAAIGLVFTAGACQDRMPTSPEIEASEGAVELLATVASLTDSSKDNPEVEVLRRTRVLESGEVASARVGILGATLELPRSGLTVTIPAGAAPLGTRIEVHAPAGGLVGYHFSPHGLRFSLPVTLTQELQGTEAEVDLVRPLLGAYFDGPLLSSVEALEIVPLQVEGGVGGTAILTISHFSGYVIATN